MPDHNGYPTDEELKRIEEWPPSENYKEWFDFIHSIWTYADWAWREEEKKHNELFRGKQVRQYSISTGGWSGNESIIEAMEKNWIAWTMTWVQSTRGGHYLFEVPIKE